MIAILRSVKRLRNDKPPKQVIRNRDRGHNRVNQKGAHTPEIPFTRKHSPRKCTNPRHCFSIKKINGSGVQPWMGGHPVRRQIDWIKALNPVSLEFEHKRREIKADPRDSRSHMVAQKQPRARIHQYHCISSPWKMKNVIRHDRRIIEPMNRRDKNKKGIRFRQWNGLAICNSDVNHRRFESRLFPLLFQDKSDVSGIPGSRKIVDKDFFIKWHLS